MLTIPGRACFTCEGPTRRELLRAGSIGLFGLNLANFFQWQKAQAAVTNKLVGSRGYDSAKSVIMVFLQGGPSHIDIWDPKPDASANIRGEFKPIKTKIPGTQISETMPIYRSGWLAGSTLQPNRVGGWTIVPVSIPPV